MFVVPSHFNRQTKSACYAAERKWLPLLSLLHRDPSRGNADGDSSRQVATSPRKIQSGHSVFSLTEAGRCVGLQTISTECSGSISAGLKPHGKKEHRIWESIKLLYLEPRLQWLSNIFKNAEEGGFCYILPGRLVWGWGGVREVPSKYYHEVALLSERDEIKNQRCFWYVPHN